MGLYTLVFNIKTTSTIAAHGPSGEIGQPRDCVICRACGPKCFYAGTGPGFPKFYPIDLRRTVLYNLFQ